MSENLTTVTLPHADWELLLEFVQVNTNRQEIASDLWTSWGDEIANLVRSQLPADKTSTHGPIGIPTTVATVLNKLKRRGLRA